VDREGRTPRRLLAHTRPPPPEEEEEEEENVRGNVGEDDGLWGAGTHDNGGWHGDPSPRVTAAFRIGGGSGSGGGGDNGGGGGSSSGNGKRRRRCDIAVVEGGMDPADFAADYLHIGRPLLLRGRAVQLGPRYPRLTPG